MEPSIHAIVAHVEKGVRKSAGAERDGPITEAKAPGPAAAKAL
jgi:hypothetical protein